MNHWHVLGVGSIGCLFAHALARAGGNVTLVRRSAATTRDTVTVESAADTRSALCHTVDAGTCGDISHLLVTTKAYDALDAVASIAHRLLPGASIVLMVNGMGLGEALTQTYPALRIYCGTTTEGAYRKGDLHIFHAGRGTTLMGRQELDAPPAWFSDYTGAIEPCAWEPDISSALWHKLAVNCVINPLTAIHRCNNGALAEGELREQVDLLCREVAQVSYAAGYTRSAQTIYADATNVIESTAANRSSMRQDVEAGRRTEIEFITGYLLQRAHEHGIGAPLNRKLMEQVLARTPSKRGKSV